MKRFLLIFLIAQNVNVFAQTSNIERFRNRVDSTLLVAMKNTCSIETYSPYCDNYLSLDHLKVLLQQEMSTEDEELALQYLLSIRTSDSSFFYNHSLLHMLNVRQSGNFKKNTSTILNKKLGLILNQIPTYTNDVDKYLSRDLIYFDYPLWDINAKEALRQIVRRDYLKLKALLDSKVQYCAYNRVDSYLKDPGRLERIAKVKKVTPNQYLDSIWNEEQKSLYVFFERKMPDEIYFLLLGWLEMKDMIPYLNRLLMENKVQCDNDGVTMPIKMALARMGDLSHLSEITSSNYGKSLKAMCYVGNQKALESCLDKLLSDTTRKYTCFANEGYRMSKEEKKNWYTPIPWVYRHIVLMQNYLHGFPKLIDASASREPCQNNLINPSMIRLAKDWVKKNSENYVFDSKSRELLIQDLSELH